MPTGINPSPQNKKTFQQLATQKERFNKGANEALNTLGAQIKKTTLELIKKKPRSGKRYKIRRGGRVYIHTASLPGEAPVEMTSALGKSFAYSVSGSDLLEFGYLKEGVEKDGAIGVIYGRALELGNPKAHVKPRPGLELALDANKKFGEEILTRDLQYEFKKQT